MTLEALRTARGSEQEAHAQALLKPATRRDTLRAVLAFLRDNPLDATRDQLVALYAHYGRNKGAFDYGAYVRADLVRALQPIAQQSDIALFAQAALTYEFPPPDFKEEGALLRSAALVALADYDLGSARYHAARMLVDSYTEPMSGEPALSAATVLGALGEDIALYGYVCDPRNATHAEVVAECLRGLTRIDPALIPDLLQRLGDPPHPVVRIGLIDLLLRHEAGVQQPEHLVAEVTHAPEEHLRYLLFTAIGAGHEELLGALVQALRTERSPQRRAAAREPLALVAQRADVKALLSLWREKSKS